jgi:glutathione peroxidase
MVVILQKYIIMKNSLLSFLLIGFLISCQNQAQSKKTSTAKTKNNMENTIYQFKVEDLEGNEFDFVSLKGKKVMIVNTASKCGLTPQYEGLEKIYKEYKDSNFVIIGFPANNFASQEPGTDAEISTFCQRNYGVTFPMMSKISVKGNDKNEVYQFLTEKAKNGLQDSDVEWNFQKYLVDENGKLSKVISPRTVPTDPEIIAWIKG